MTFTKPTRPTLFPELRAALVDEDFLWRGIALFAQFQPRFVDPAALRFGLRDAELWWIDDACCDLLTEVAPTMPPVSLTPEFIPAGQGFVCFARPIVGADSRTGAEVTIDYLQWQPLLLRGRPGISIVPWGDPFERSSRVPPSPLGRSDWLLGTATDMRFDDVSDVVHRSVVEDRRFLAALWQLTAQTITRSTETRIDKAARRRLERTGHEPSPVRLVNLARKASTRRSAAEPAGREYSCQWPVVGHWRQQPYGPGRSLRKAIYIQPQIRGPEDKPLRVRDTVKVWQQ